MTWFNLFVIPFIAVLGISLLLPKSSERARNPWLRGLFLWPVLALIETWILSRAHDKSMLTQWDFFFWAPFVTTLLLSATCVVHFLWPKGLGSPPMPGWRLDLGVGLVMLAARLAILFW